MKYLLKIIVVLFILITCKELNAQNTEEYAILTHYMGTNSSTITVNIGDKIGENVEYKRPKNEPNYSPTGVISEMNKLNGKGYELVSSTAVPGNVYGIYTYVFVRKIKEE